ncbi:hypothetical protein [Streptomyces malaysiensis]|uniref:hypothetical protein n=1 Tax=Streptomyces malaysiensis TaxID=92644 RepID=UPI001FE4417E|nr:hypothetical protein [Streptomyces solisilvae]
MAARAAAEDGPAGRRPDRRSGPGQDAAAPAAREPAAAQAPAAGPASQGPGATFHFSGGTPSFGGSLVAGDQHGVSGGTVHGDVHLGGTDQGGTR